MYSRLLVSVMISLKARHMKQLTKRQNRLFLQCALEMGTWHEVTTILSLWQWSLSLVRSCVDMRSPDINSRCYCNALGSVVLSKSLGMSSSILWYSSLTSPHLALHPITFPTLPGTFSSDSRSLWGLSTGPFQQLPLPCFLYWVSWQKQPKIHPELKLSGRTFNHQVDIFAFCLGSSCFTVSHEKKRKKVRDFYFLFYGVRFLQNLWIWVPSQSFLSVV